MNLRKLFLSCLLSLLAWGACSSEIPRPIANAGGDKTNVTVGQVVQLDGTGSADPSGLPLSYAWTFVDLPPGSAAQLLAAETAKPYFTPDKVGSYGVQLVVSNGAVASDPVRAIVTTGTCGANLPVVTIDDPTKKMTVQLHQNTVVPLSATVKDADIDACKLAGRSYTGFKYDWKLSSAPAGSAATLAAADTKTPWIKPDLKGSYTISLTVTDDVGQAALATPLTIDVDNCGAQPPDAPVITAPTAMQQFAVGSVVQFTSTEADPDTMCTPPVTESFGFQWSIVQAPPGSQAALNLPTASNPSLTIDKRGSYTVQLVVTDSQGLASPATTVQFVANPCGDNAPSIKNSDVVVTPATPAIGAAAQLSVAAIQDADTQAPCNANNKSYTLAWTLLALPQGSQAALNNPSAQNPSFTPDQPGDYVVGVTATDNLGHVGPQQSLDIKVGVCGSAVPSIPNNGITVTTPFANKLHANTTWQLSVPVINDADVANCMLPANYGYSWVLAAAPQKSKAKFNGTTLANPTFTPDQTGSYTFQLVVTNAEGHKSPVYQQTFNTTACGASPPVAGITMLVPNANGLTPQAGLGAATVQLSALAAINPSSSPDNSATCNMGKTLTYQWSFVSVPLSYFGKMNDTGITDPSFTMTQAGDYVVQLVVTDSTGLVSAPVTFTTCTGGC